MTTAAGFAVAFALSDWLGFFVIIYLAALVAYYFTIIHHVGDGQPGLPGPSDAADDWFATAGYATRGILCVAFGLAPLFVWVIAKHSVPSPQMILLLLAAGQVLMPAVLLAVAFSNTSLAVIYPVAWIQIIARAPLAYLRFAAIWMASIGFGLAIYVGTVAAFGRLGIIGMFGSAFVWSLFWFAQASLVGNFLRANAPAYGWD